jgi:hypothetical protein
MEDRGHVHGYSKTHGAIGVGHSYSYLGVRNLSVDSISRYFKIPIKFTIKYIS